MAEGIDTKDLESAINSQTNPAPISEVPGTAPAPKTSAPQQNSAPQMSAEEEIGFHKGALNTLVAERNELIKMIGNVEAIIQAHVGRLKELGVEIK